MKDPFLRTAVQVTGRGSRPSFSTCGSKTSVCLGLTNKTYLRLVDWMMGHPGELSLSIGTSKLMGFWVGQLRSVCQSMGSRWLGQNWDKISKN